MKFNYVTFQVREAEHLKAETMKGCIPKAKE